MRRRRLLRKDLASILTICFECLLALAVILFVVGNRHAAEEVAVYSFTALLGGVLLRLLALAREDRAHNHIALEKGASKLEEERYLSEIPSQLGGTKK